MTDLPISVPLGIAVALCVLTPCGNRTDPFPPGQVIDKGHFVLSLDDSWRERPTDVGFDFVNEATAEQLTLTIEEAKRTLSHDELRNAVAGLLEIRKRSLAELSNGQAFYSIDHFDGSAVPVIAVLGGADPHNGVCFGAQIRGYPAKVVTFMYVKYGCTQHDSIQPRLEQLLSSLVVRGTQNLDAPD